MEKKKQKAKFNHIARESMPALLEEAKEREVSKEDIITILVKNNMFYLVYVE